MGIFFRALCHGESRRPQAVACLEVRPPADRPTFVFLGAPFSHLSSNNNTHLRIRHPHSPPNFDRDDSLVARRAELIMMTKKAFNPSDATAKCPLGIRGGTRKRAALKNT